MNQPLILTLQLDEAAQVCYEELRRRYFPPHRNLIPAHLSMFHQLPDEAHICETIREVAHSTRAFALENPVARSIGRGVAVFVRAEALTALHGELTRTLKADLIPQDRQRFQPHIVVQNKVDAETARRTLAELQSTLFREPQAIGLTLWRYLNGPWEHVRYFAFASGGEF